jgi:hypothetical protein
MRSSSTLAIEWVRPELAAEAWEFSRHPAKQEFYLRHGVTWEALVAGHDLGCLTPYPRGGELAGLPVALSYSSYDDYCRYLARAKRGYRRSYTLMEEALQRHGTLTLPAPIVLRCGDEGLLFSGYRRLCLAWNYGMVPCAWMLPV